MPFVCRGRCVLNELAGEADQFTALGRVRQEHRIENSNAVQLLFPDHCVQPVVCRHVFSFHPGGLQNLRSVAKQRLVLRQKCLRGAMPVIGSKAAQACFRDGPSHAICAREKAGSSADTLRAGRDFVEIDLRLRKTLAQLGCGVALFSRQ